MDPPPEQKLLFLFCLPLIDTCHGDPQNAFIQDPCSFSSWLMRGRLSQPLECPLLLVGVQTRSICKSHSSLGPHAPWEQIKQQLSRGIKRTENLSHLNKSQRPSHDSAGRWCSTMERHSLQHKQKHTPSHQIPQVSSRPIPSGSQLLSSRLLQPVETIVSHVSRHCTMALAAASDTPVPLGRPARVSRVRSK